jgi:hypothetical protein
VPDYTTSSLRGSKCVPCSEEPVAQQLQLAEQNNPSTGWQGQMGEVQLPSRWAGGALTSWSPPFQRAVARQSLVGQ